MKSSTIPGTPPIEKQQQLLAQLEAVQQQIWKDEERAERDRAEREKVEREQRAREEVELLEWERARLQKKLAERQRAEKERAEKERARKPMSGHVESHRSSPEAGPSKRRRDDDDADDDNDDDIVNITPKRKRARTETVWAPVKKSCAECKEKRIACLFSVGCSRVRACQACVRSKTKCTEGQWADKTPAVVISDNEPLVTPTGPSTPRKKAAPAEKPTEKVGPAPGSSSKARGKKRETTAEREERERKQKEFERKEKEIDDAVAPTEADLPFSRRAQREITVLKTLRYAMSEIRQFREELEELRREMRLTHSAISDLARSREGIYQEYFGGITNLLEREPSDGEEHPESDPDWAEMGEFGVGDPDWALGSEAEHGLEPGQEEAGQEQGQEQE
ncbi:hypothetical protein DICSQDRAFT_173578 [Dichomitus squalens LYAD-421 SS1]|uniref:Zn(2)-C6 fungal-type domain-containing protein n=1 Tax=Dichomitus squalens (strain LYAD-421) TaxID=732165 RepID=R7SS78_DICSQ|nr:uncharacterized protein DICSQDRAFT_173578 [Dichomitus squalens LYAD-421 SS1]EJF57827.1 hypothetical protein DICSQDRAFT_173578 [Dichomitus squalens LYAD-421 SS1]